MRRISALLVDAQEMMQIGVSHILSAHEIDVVATCATSADAIRLALMHKPDLVVMDTCLPEGSTLDTCRGIKTADPRVQVVFLTALDCAQQRNRCRAAGGDGYFLKSVAARALVDAIQILVSGRRRAARPPGLAGPVPAPLSIVLRTLSPQEQRILPLVADGKTNKEIAEILGLSDKTVKNYLSNIYLKLQVTRRSQVAALFARSAR